MNSVGGGGTPLVLTTEAMEALGEGVSLVLSRWTALQMAVQNGWGGRNSRMKVDEFAASIVDWFSKSKAPLYIDDLENILDENMVLSFNTELEDGSIEEVAEQLMIMHEDCLQGNFESIERLRNLGPINAAQQSQQIINEDDEESSDEDASDMMVDEPDQRETLTERPSTKPVPDEEGWCVVPTRRSKGRRSG